MAKISMTVNGAPVTREVPDNTLLVFFLREALGLTGTHVGCDTTQCGCCVVHMNGRSVKSCTVLAAQAEGANVTTIEGLAKDGKLNPVQQAFHTCHALQCGYCTPGMILAAVALLEQNSDPSEAQIVDALQKHICRCGTYRRIIKAVRLAAQALGEHTR